MLRVPAAPQASMPTLVCVVPRASSPQLAPVVPLVCWTPVAYAMARASAWTLRASAASQSCLPRGSAVAQMALTAVGCVAGPTAAPRRWMWRSCCWGTCQVIVCVSVCVRVCLLVVARWAACIHLLFLVGMRSLLPTVANVTATMASLLGVDLSVIVNVTITVLPEGGQVG